MRVPMLSAAMVALCLGAGAANNVEWPQWRGPFNTGMAAGDADAGLDHRFEVLAIDRGTGKVVWQRTAAVATPWRSGWGTHLFAIR